MERIHRNFEFNGRYLNIQLIQVDKGYSFKYCISVDGNEITWTEYEVYKFKAGKDALDSITEAGALKLAVQVTKVMNDNI